MKFRAICNAFVLPGNSEPLLGAIPLEELDVIIHLQRQELIVNPDHPDGAMVRIPTLLPADRIPWLVRNQLRGFYLVKNRVNTGFRVALPEIHNAGHCFNMDHCSDT